MTHPGGRPLKFKTPEELQEKIDVYFEETKKEEWTITGLALALDTYRSVLCDYETLDNRKEYSNTIKKAKLKVEYSYELDLKKSGRTGTIFALKNFNWKDRQELTGKDGESLIPATIDASKLTGDELNAALKELIEKSK